MSRIGALSLTGKCPSASSKRSATRRWRRSILSANSAESIGLPAVYLNIKSPVQYSDWCRTIAKRLPVALYLDGISSKCGCHLPNHRTAAETTVVDKVVEVVPGDVRNARNHDGWWELSGLYRCVELAEDSDDISDIEPERPADGEKPRGRKTDRQMTIATATSDLGRIEFLVVNSGDFDFMGSVSHWKQKCSI
uniref:Uncharacterized protein n=1 Tax=Rhodopseudomonas palustris (strain BisA53) TaxID=316055 RepID=Q07NR0_RHOP5